MRVLNPPADGWCPEHTSQRVGTRISTGRNTHLNGKARGLDELDRRMGPAVEPVEASVVLWECGWDQ
jgi:hypothetical protein